MRKLRGLANQHNLQSPDTRFLTIVHDDPRSNQTGHARVHAGVSVETHFQPAAGSELAIHDVPPGPHAVYRHVGPYKALRDAWGHFASLPIPAGYKLNDKVPSFELYHNDPAHTAEDQLITDLYQPLEAVP